MGFIKNLSHKVDIYGLPLTFEEEESSKVATFGGLVGSVLTMAFIIAMSILFGRELIQRRHPFSITSEERIESSSVFLKEMPLIFNFHLDLGERLDGRLYFEMDVYQFYTYESITSDMDLYLKKCDYRDYTKHQEWVRKLTENTTVDYLCLAHNNTSKIVNPYGYPNSTFIHISFRKCDSTKRKCAKDLDRVLSDVYIQTLYQDAYVDVNNNDNPVTFYEAKITSQNNLSFLKRSFISFRSDVLIDDSGWLLEHYNTTDYITLGNIRVDMNPSYGRLTDNLYWMTFDSPQIRKRISRSYMKLQDLLAKIGGIVKGSLLIVEILLIYYSRFKYTFFVIKCVINSEEDFKNLAVEKINIFSVMSKKTQNLTIPKTAEINEIRKFSPDGNEDLNNLKITPKNLNLVNNQIVEINKLNSSLRENSLLEAERSINKSKNRKENQDSLDLKNKSDMKMLNHQIPQIQKNNFIFPERKGIEEQLQELKDQKEKNGTVKVPNSYSNMPSYLKEEDVKFRNEFKKMMTEVDSLDSYWMYVWSTLCFDKKKIKLYNKYNTLFSKLISFKKMIKIRSRVNNDSEIVNKSQL